MPLKSALMLSAAFIGAASAQPTIPGYDFTRASASYAGGMDLDDTAGEMEIYALDLRTALSKPIPLGGNLIALPVIHYKGTRINFKDNNAAFPIQDEDVHSISLSSFFIHSRAGSPWILGAWTRAELATDFQHINSDDFTFDLAAGVAYKLSDSFTVGFGGAVLNLNNEPEFYVGPAFDWRPNDCFRAGLYGPNVVVAWTPSTDWELSLRGEAAGDEWNIRDAGGRSTTLNLDSYRLGLFVDRRLSGDLWLRVGGGMTMGNEIEYMTPNGRRLFNQEVDDGWFGEVALRLATW